MANRIDLAIQLIQARLDAITEAKRESLMKSMSLTFDEFYAYQTAQSVACAGGKITAEEAQTIYRALGGEGYKGNWPESTPLAARVAITKVVAELMGAK